jgi:protein ImuB
MSGRAGVTDLIDRLGNRLGPKRVLRLEPRASHLPERASRPVSALAHTDTPAAAFPGSEAPGSPRPVRLLPTPEPIEVIAPVPDHPPVIFRWRRAQHRIARADGPERIGPEWWLEPPRDLASGQSRLRDYYRIEDTEGVRFWVYRAGPYHASAPPRWYLHGFFP